MRSIARSRQGSPERTAGGFGRYVDGRPVTRVLDLGSTTLRYPVGYLMSMDFDAVDQIAALRSRAA